MTSRQRGFTLIEIMVALAILAVAMVAIYKSVAGYVSNASYLEQRTLAQWAASNLAEERRFESPWPKIEKRDGILEGFAGHDWFWRTEVRKETDDGMIRRVEVKIYLDEEAKSPLGKLTYYVVQP